MANTPTFGSPYSPYSPSAPTSPSLRSRGSNEFRERDDAGDTTATTVSGDNTMDESTLAGGLGDPKGKGKGKAAETADSSPGGERMHSFPPRRLEPSPTRTPPSPSPQLSSAPYASTTPQSMSAAARARPPSPSGSTSLREASTAHNNAQGGPLYPILTHRPSVQSQRSSFAPESVFGSAPTGVIGRHKPREIVRIERDYSSGELCQFWSGWIWELEGRISPTEYQNTLNELNEVLASAHNPYKSCFDNTLAVLTLYLSPLVLGSHYEREMRHFDRALEKANRDIYNPAGLNILSPRRTAFLFMEIEYY